MSRFSKVIDALFGVTGWIDNTAEWTGLNIQEEKNEGLEGSIQAEENSPLID